MSNTAKAFNQMLKQTLLFLQISIGDPVQLMDMASMTKMYGILGQFLIKWFCKISLNEEQTLRKLLKARKTRAYIPYTYGYWSRNIVDYHTSNCKAPPDGMRH